MVYEFQLTPSGTVQTSQNGMILETSTPELAATKYGYSATPKPTSNPSVLSSKAGADIVAQQTAKLNKLSSNPVTQATLPQTEIDRINKGSVDAAAKANQQTQVQPTPATKVTLINPETEQTITYEDAVINRDNIQRYLSAGYELSEASGAIPSWLQPGGVSTTDTAEDKAKAAITQAEADLKSLTDNLSKFMVSDADLSEQVKGITALWDSRIADMQRVNNSRTASINTLGIRLGSRYAGGSGGQFGGIVSEEERQGIIRIGELEAQKQAAISAAKTAALSQNWSVYSKQIDIAEKAYANKVKELETLQKATADQNKLIADALKQQEKDYYDRVTKPINDILTSAAEHGAPKEVRDAISAVLDSDNPNIADAITAAGDYLQDVPTSGIVGEYLFYVKQAKLAGQEPVDFNAYQDIDANRKRSIAAAGASGGSGLSNTMLAKVLQVAGQFDGEQIVKDYNTTATQVNYISSLGGEATDDMARVYAFAKVMDPNSAVREGEYATVQGYAQAVLQAAGLRAKRVFTNSGFLTDEARSFIDRTLQQRLTTQKQAYDNLYNDYGRRIDKMTGGADGTDYITDYSQGFDTTGTLIQSESKAQQAVTDFGAKNPTAREQILSLAGVPQEDLGGRAYTWVEIAQILGINVPTY